MPNRISYREYRKDVLEKQQRRAFETYIPSYTADNLTNQQEIMKLLKAERHLSSIKVNLQSHLIALEATGSPRWLSSPAPG